MRLLFINRHFGNEQVPTGRMLRDVVNAVLDETDCTVCVLSAKTSYIRDDDQEEAVDERIKLKYLWTPKESRRFLCWITFWLQACILAPLMSWDRCVLLTDPPFLTVIAALSKLKFWTRRKVYLWTMDLYPECVVRAGIFPEGGVLHRFLRAMNSLGFRNLSGAVLLGECQDKWLETYRGWPKSEGFRVIVPPWDNRPLPRVAREENRFIHKHGLAEKKIALYAGNLGQAHSYTEILSAAKCASQNPESDWLFVFVVRGLQRESLERDAVDIRNVLVLDYEPVEMTADLLWSADVHLITMKSGWEGLIVPSKLYGVLKTSKPVVFVGPPEADTAQEIEAFGAGHALPGNCPGSQLLAAVEQLGQNQKSNNREIQRDGAREIAKFITQ